MANLPNLSSVRFLSSVSSIQHISSLSSLDFSETMPSWFCSQILSSIISFSHPKNKIVHFLSTISFLQKLYALLASIIVSLQILNLYLSTLYNEIHPNLLKTSKIFQVTNIFQVFQSSKPIRHSSNATISSHTHLSHKGFKALYLCLPLQCLCHQLN